ncbi:MAG: lipoprotein-releasing ABC transporter permease subunit [Betaproteobacteria bacterium]|nr:MAG: lipoprotein-releasing ABC transporter permease subunit [Betaproteobacteria bacterium]
MLRPYEVYIGLRYTRARRRSHFISVISLISVLGITLGIAALITVLSVMNGFGKELRERILGVVSHVTITEGGGRLHDWREVSKRIQDPRVVGRAPYVVGQGMVTRGKAVSGVMARGILPNEESQVSEFQHKMLSGSLDSLKSGEFNIVVGASLAWKLDLEPGSHVSLVIPQAQSTAAGLLPRFRRFTVGGVFKMDMHEYDSGLVLIHLDDAAKLYQLNGAVTGLRLKLDNLDIAPVVSEQIAMNLGPQYRARDWTREHGNFFRALKIEKTVMFVILLLIVTVAMFNVVSALVMIVNEKEADIAILRTLGASPSSIMGIFMVNGAVVGVLGTVVGTIAGIALAFNVEAIVQGLESLLRTSFISADVYFISELPSDLHWQDVAIISICSLVLALVSTIYPAWRAAKVQPAEALRYE